jgi:acetyl-CoA carboxylase biotin carboxyl carrier protein
LGEETIVPLDANELREILLTLNQTDIAELHFKTDDFELNLKRAAAAPVAAPVQPVQSTAPAHAIAASPTMQSEVIPSTSALSLDKYIDVPSPIVGTFYSSPGPEESPFVEIGMKVRKGQVVCIIEAMKIMNEIEAEVSGEVTEILVQNGQPIEYGQPLMRVNPA